MLVLDSIASEHIDLKGFDCMLSAWSLEMTA